SCDTAVLNGDDPSTQELKKRTRAKVITFSLQGDGDLQASEIQYEEGMTKFLVNKRVPFEISLLGEFNVKNALAALAVGRIFQIHLEEARETLRSFRTCTLRMEVTSRGGITLLNDSYNANPTSMLEALKVLSQYSGKGGRGGLRRRIAILGDMLELGERGPEWHRKVGEAAAQLGINLLLTFGPLSSNILEGARSCGMKEAYWFEKKRGLLDFLKSASDGFKKGDVVLVKGSRGMKMEEVVERIKKQCKM
ncbi:UDP-N-acetylmuramoyl-tripeptide--D-alanyl-D-alanine ligase, partial [candidate division TA06 bacterium]|nr:UDP-N-acetylmuramoyl-tripeptide--D-alanyl-D-alanine ligase [candidate division TA06 bacterium]